MLRPSAQRAQQEDQEAQQAQQPERARREQLAAELRVLAAQAAELMARKAAGAPARQAALLGAAPGQGHQRETPPHQQQAQAASASEAAASNRSWLQRKVGPGSAVAAGHAVLAVLQKRAAAGRPLQRLHGPRPPEHVGAAIRSQLFKKQFSDQVMKRLLVEVTKEQLAQRAKRGGEGGDRRRWR